jgi:hypothetical protein
VFLVNHFVKDVCISSGYGFIETVLSSITIQRSQPPTFTRSLLASALTYNF